MRHSAAQYESDRRALLTVQDVADYLSVSRRTVERLVAAGTLTPVRVGTRRRFRPEDVDAYLEGDP